MDDDTIRSYCPVPPPRMTLAEFVTEVPVLAEAFAEAVHQHGDPSFTTPRPLAHWLHDLAAYVRVVEMGDAVGHLTNGET